MSASQVWICAPDSFKGTHNAAYVAETMAIGMRRGGAGEVHVIPMADGGEGSMEALSAALQVEWHQGTAVRVRPEQGEIGARWLSLTDGTCVLELASVAGVASLDPSERDPALVSTYGIGMVLRQALEGCPRQVVLALGGSVTVDGGLGLLQALGARIRVDGRELDRPVLGGELACVQAVDLEPALQRVAGVDLIVAADVRNPLLGPRGAVAQFAPQKGAAPESLPVLEAGLARFSDLLGDPGTDPGDGAAGGVAFGLRVGLGATVTSGARYFAGRLGLVEACAHADGIVTGEGCYDMQTLEGKVAWEVASIASSANVPCGVIAGRITLDPEERAVDPFAWHVSLEEIAGRHPELDGDEALLAAAGERIVRLSSEG